MGPVERRVLLALGWLVAAPGAARAGEVGASVLEALGAAGGPAGRARVIVSLAEPEAPMRSLTRRLAEVESVSLS